MSFILRDIKSGKDYPLSSGENVIGRDDEADLTISDKQLSRLHFKLTVNGGEVTAEDLDSTNGTKINARPLKTPVAISANDIIYLGASSYRVIFPNAADTTVMHSVSPNEDASYSFDGYTDDGTLIRQKIVLPQGWSTADSDFSSSPAEKHSVDDKQINKLFTDAGVATDTLLGALVGVSGAYEGAIILLRKKKQRSWTLGRSSECKITLPDDTISQHHADFRFEAERWMIQDKGSSNGSFVNGVKITEQTIEHNDRIKLGNLEFVFRVF